MDQDPGFVPVSWDEALDIVAAKLNDIRSRGLLDDEKLPRVALTLGHGGTPANDMGTFCAFIAAWGPMDFSFGSGQGGKCGHSEHLYGEYWRRAFTVAADTPHCNYIVSIGANVEVTGGVCAPARHADARIRGAKRIQIEPHLSVTAAASAEWIPIKPKTDPALMFAMIHVLLHEVRRAQLDLPFLRDVTSSPYLIGPQGFFLRDPATLKPLLWDARNGRAQPHDAPGIEPALEGEFDLTDGVEVGADEQRRSYPGVQGVSSFSRLVAHMHPYCPEWANALCDVPAAKIRQVALEFVAQACVGQTREVDATLLPYRPVAVTLGKTVNNGWGAYECCWARTLPAVLVGALEVPGGILGTTVRINSPREDRHKSVQPGPDGFMLNKLNPTTKDKRLRQPTGRDRSRVDSEVERQSNAPAPGWPRALSKAQRAARTRGAGKRCNAAQGPWIPRPCG